MLLDQGDGRIGGSGAYVKPVSVPQARQGTVYVQSGCSGSVRTNKLGRHPATFFETYQLGSLVLDINSNRLDVVFLRETDAVDDSFTIIKGAPEPLRLLPLVFQNGNTIVRWKSIPGQSYRVEQTENWLAPNWQLAGDPVKATGATTSWTNSTTPGGPAFFYRVLQIPDTEPGHAGQWQNGGSAARRATPKRELN
jgi:hypothetical protein